MTLPPPVLAVVLAAVLAIAVAGPAGAASVDTLPQPNWDPALARELGAAGRDDPRVGRWLDRARVGAFDDLVREFNAWAIAPTPSAPAREAAVFAFTTALPDHMPTPAPDPDGGPPAQVSGALDRLLSELEAWPVRTLVPHEESDQLAVPLFNIPAAARGARSAIERQAGRRHGAALLRSDPAAWLDAYRASGDAARAGHLDALGAAPDRARASITHAAMDSVSIDPAMTAAAIRAVDALHDPDAAVRLLASGGPGDYAGMLRRIGLRTPERDRARLLLGAVEAAPADRAGLAIAILAPGLVHRPEVSASLFDLLADPQLGAAAALALARSADDDILQRLERLAAGQDLAGQRAALALSIRTPDPAAGSRR